MNAKERFAQIFRMNVLRRSRTAKGSDEGAETSSSKKQLLLSGEELEKKVKENTENLIADVSALPTTGISANILRQMALRWFNLASDGLCDFAAYREEFRALQNRANRFGRSLGRKVDVNKNYRLWTPKYTTPEIPPLWLEKFMDEFYLELSFRLRAFRDLFPQKDANKHLGALSEFAAQTMAYADLMMDGEIHPWIDGCSRVSTALVMYVARYLDAPLPLFSPNREEHYASITDFDAHIEYFKKALERAAKEVPE